MNNKQNLEFLRNVLKKENEVNTVELEWNNNKLSRITLGKDLVEVGISGNSYYVYVKYYYDKQSNGMEISPLVVGMTRNKIVKGVPKGGDLIFNRGASETNKPNAKTFLDCINCMYFNFDGEEKGWDEWFENQCLKYHFQYNQPSIIGGNINLYNN